MVKGVNRHSFSVDGGRATSAAMSRQDALLVKEMNMNAVRSHYPPDEHFLDMCDSLGIVYMDELAGWQNGYDSKVGPKLVKEMIERDVNHPPSLFGVMATKEDGIIILILYSPNTINYRNATWYILGPISMIWTPTIIPLI